ncbi:hypothetical protein QVD99_005940 [Batrachochytrium dendrobatidis]|nr:hypothetical protein O5D80_006126 [Batrachochytrium dendrobatidis]KAK5667335.1 hypothetical protein QVD99_005940 [Batrachochytrium dendrobatidis]
MVGPERYGRGGNRGGGRGRDHGGSDYSRRGAPYYRGRGGGRGGSSYAGYGQNRNEGNGYNEHSRDYPPNNYNNADSLDNHQYDQTAHYQDHQGQSWRQQPYPDPSSYQQQTLMQNQQQYDNQGGQQHTQSGSDGPAEATCRTLFVRNVSFDATESDIRRVFEPYGEIKLVFDLISRRGIVFVTYYDLRAAERARVALQETMFAGRQIDVHYSLPKAEEKNNGDCTVKLHLRDSRSELNGHDAQELLARFGDIKKVREDADGDPLVEFWDMRSADSALDYIEANPSFKGGRLSAKIVWDTTNIDESSLKPIQHADPRRQNLSHGYDRDLEHHGRGGSSHRGGRGGSYHYEDRGRSDDFGRGPRYSGGYNGGQGYDRGDVQAPRPAGGSLLDSLVGNTNVQGQGGSGYGQSLSTARTTPSQTPLTQLLQPRVTTPGPASQNASAPMAGGSQDAMSLLRLLGQVQQQQAQSRQQPPQQVIPQQQGPQSQSAAPGIQLGTPGATSQLAHLLALIGQATPGATPTAIGQPLQTPGAHSVIGAQTLPVSNQQANYGYPNPSQHQQNRPPHGQQHAQNSRPHTSSSLQMQPHHGVQSQQQDQQQQLQSLAAMLLQQTKK